MKAIDKDKLMIVLIAIAYLCMLAVAGAEFAMAVKKLVQKDYFNSFTYALIGIGLLYESYRLGKAEIKMIRK